MPPCHLKQFIFSLFRPVISFRGRSRRSQNNTGTVHGSNLNRRLPGMVLRHGFAFIAALVLLIHYNDTQIWKRCKQRRSGPNDHIQFPGLCPSDLVIFLSLGEGRIDHRHSVAKSPVKPQQSLIRKCDLRDQHNGLLPHPDHLFYDPQIDFRLTAPRNAMHQIGSRLSRSVIPDHILYDLLLCSAWNHPFLFPRRTFDRITIVSFRLYFQTALFFQRSKCSRSHVQLLSDQFIGKDLIRHQRLQYPGLCRLVLLLALPERLQKGFPFHAPCYLPVFQLLQFLLYGKHRLKRRNHG